MAKIFVDVGGYRGESSKAALDPRFGFDKVFCFEPVRSCYEHIVRNLHDRRLEVCNAGLLDRPGIFPIYYAGTLGGSVFADAPKQQGGSTEQCEFIEATQFFKDHISTGDHVWMKLNCEGAECSIILNLFKHNEASKLTEVLLDLDAKRIDSAHNQLTQLQALLELAPFSWHYPEEVQYEMVNNYGGIRNWLIVTGAVERGQCVLAKSIAYQAPLVFNPAINGYYKVRLLRALGLRPQASVPTKPGSVAKTR